MQQNWPELNGFLAVLNGQFLSEKNFDVFLVGVEDDLRWWTADTAVQLLQFLERENRRHQPTEIFKMREKIFQIFREMFLAMTSKLF